MNQKSFSSKSSETDNVYAETVKVLHFELDSRLGGIESFLYNLHRQMKKKEVKYSYVTSSEKPALLEEFLSLNGEICRVSPHRRVFQYWRDVARMMKCDYDVVHIHKNSAANIIPVLLARRNRKIVIVHAHNTNPSRGKITKVLHYINRKYLCKAADIRLACSEDAGRWMFGNYDYQMIRNGICADGFRFRNSIRDQKREELGIEKNALVIGHIGRFTEQKNQEALIDIFYHITEEYPRAVLLLIGEGERMAMVKEKATEIGLDHQVIFTGIRSDISGLLMAMDVFVMPSRYEGLPLVGVEAQAAGLPAAFSDTISRDVEITESVAWFSLKDSPAATASVVLKLVEETSAEIRGYRNAQVVRRGYDIRKTAEDMMGIYQMAAEKQLGNKEER